MDNRDNDGVDFFFEPVPSSDEYFSSYILSN